MGDQITHAGALAHSMLPVYSRRIEYARACIVKTLEFCENPYVAFSGGKDSSVMLDLVLATKPDCHALMLTGGESRLLHSNLDNVLEYWRNKYPGAQIREILIDHVYTPGWKTASFLEMYISFKNGWVKYFHRPFDYDGFFVGLRSEESAMRKRVLRIRESGCKFPILKLKTRQCYRSAPIAYFTLQDVMSYLLVNDIPVLTGYESGFNARVETRINWNAGAHNGQLARLRERDPAAYNELVTRFPELKEFT